MSVKQTAVNNTNQLAFYRQMYPVQRDSVENLIDISSVNDPIIAIDCCGWHYKDLFDKQIIMLETLKTAHQFALDIKKFDKLIDNRIDGKIVWPKINYDLPVLLLDRSPLLRYKTVFDLNILLKDMVENYRPKMLLLRGSLLVLDDFRLDDRFYSFKELCVDGFVITKFLYDTYKHQWQITLKTRI